MTLVRTDEEWRALTTTLKQRLGALRKAYRELQRTYEVRERVAQQAIAARVSTSRQVTEYWEKWRLANDEIARRDAEIRGLKDELLKERAPSFQRTLVVYALVVGSVLLGVLMALAWGTR